MQPNDRTNGELDAAIVAYREDPTPANRERVLALARAHTEHFHAEERADYQRRTT